jgi:hypothetical protein
MDKRNIQVAGYTVTQLNETEYEAENKFQKLDFHFDTGRPEAVEVFVFDSEVPTQGGQDPCVAAFYAEDLEEAVVKAMNLKCDALPKANPNSTDEIVQSLRDIANRLTATPNPATQTVLFPGWHEGYEEGAEPLIKEAARAILASGVSPDEGTRIRLTSVAALLHYVADMME